MGRTYILAFGGTGAKVMESLTMLIAAGSFGNPEIVPLLFDFDWNDCNIRKAVDLMELYRDINNNVYSETNQSIEGDRKYFGSKLMKLSDIGEPITQNSDIRTPLILDPYRLEDALRQFNSVTFPSCSFNPLCLLSQSLYGERMQNSVEILESASGINGDISITRFLYGIYGFSDDICIKELTNLVMPGDKIVVVGSTFGCTGVAGMLEILKLFRTHHRIFNYIEKAFVLLDPYYMIEGHSMSDTFKQRSEAFLKAYNAFEDVPKNTYRVLSAGGMTMRGYIAKEESQVDASAPSELTAAVAIGDFIKSHPQVNDSILCEINAGNRDNLQNLLYVAGIAPDISFDASSAIGSFSLFSYCNEKYRFLDDVMHNHALMHHLSLYEKKPEELTSRIMYFTQRYIKWWNEIAGNSDGQLDIFDFDTTSLNLIIKGKQLRTRYLFMFVGNRAYRSFQDEFRSRIFSVHHADNVPAYERILKSSDYAARQILDRDFINN